MNAPDPSRCPHCGRYITTEPTTFNSSFAGHTIDCPAATPEDLRMIAQGYQDKMLVWQKKYFVAQPHHLRSMDRWELAYRRVKEENNALRKKLYPGKC